MWIDRTILSQLVWRFPKIGLPPNVPFCGQIFHEIPQPFVGAPIYGNSMNHPNIYIYTHYILGINTICLLGINTICYTIYIYAINFIDVYILYRHVHTYIYIYTMFTINIYIYIYLCIHCTYMHTYIHTYLHTYIYTYIHRIPGSKISTTISTNGNTGFPTMLADESHEEPQGGSTSHLVANLVITSISSVRVCQTPSHSE